MKKWSLMIRKNNGKLEWLEFELLADIPEITHGVFLRHGGVSEEPFASLNVIKGVDESQNVEENRNRILETLKLEKLIAGYQVHGKHVVHVRSDNDDGVDCDALVTNKPNWGLMAVHADCQAALFYDPIHRAVATAHAGWRGQVQNIYLETIMKMTQTFGSRPEDLLVCISPSLGPENSEFLNYQNELPEEFWRFQIKPTYFDLWAVARHQLEACGVPCHHIQIAEIDTYAHPTDLFSYRREKALGRTERITGGHGSVIALN